MKKLLIVFIVFLFGCDFKLDFSNVNIGDYLKDNYDYLSAPQNIRIEGDVVVWNKVENASGYMISLFDQAGSSILEEMITEGETFSLAGIDSNTVKTIKLKSLGNGNDLFDSPYSFSLSYTSQLPFDREDVIFQNDPQPLMPIPSAAQVAWHQLEQYAFIHYGPNTYQNREWGEGKPAEGNSFRPENYGGNNADVYTKQWIDEMKGIGMNGLIFTAKHHDGFCMFQSKTTLYSLRNPIYSGKGNDDVVKSLAKQCHDNNMRLGLYLSPGDRNNWAYREDDYKYIFREQVNELIEIAKSQQGENPVGLFEIWFDGANQLTGWYGGDTYAWHKSNGATALPVDANGDWNGDTNYDYFPLDHNPTSLPSRGNTTDNNTYLSNMKIETRKQIYDQNESVVIFGDTIRWIGNERGWSGRTNWAMGWGESGQEHSQLWIPGEVDVKTEPGWFNSTSATSTKSYLDMIEFWYRSVGRNATLLLNFSPARNGLIQDNTLIQARKYWQTIQKHFEKNLVTDSELLESIEASNIRGSNPDYSPQNLVDEDFETYWATDDTATENQHVTLTFKNPVEFNRVMLQEYITLGQRVKEFKVEYSTTASENDFTSLTYPELPPYIYNSDGSGDNNSPDTTTTIGYKRILRHDPVTAKRVKVTFIKNREISSGVDANVPFVISKIGLYNAVDPAF